MEPKVVNEEIQLVALNQWLPTFRTPQTSEAKIRFVVDCNFVVDLL